MRKTLSKLKLFFKYFQLSKNDRNDLVKWWRDGFLGPAPHFVKMNVLKSFGYFDLWIETGTYMGETTEHLSKRFPSVITIEPDPFLYERARKKFSSINNVEVINNLSELVLEGILNRVQRDKIKSLGFWLDGHFSEGITFKGPLETPIVKELEVIENYLGEFDRICIFIDDFRSFVNAEAGYPEPGYLVDWAVHKNFLWEIQHDIFIIRQPSA